MIFDPKIFYQTYLKDFHRIKVTYLKKILDNLPQYEQDFFGKDLTEEERKDFSFTLMSDLRQTYFHSIETFFDLFFALNPRGKEQYDDEYVLFRLTNSNWTDTYTQIKEIAKNETALDFLDEKIIFSGFEITIGQYIFYMGFFSDKKFSPEFFKDIFDSIDAIKYGMRILASDFINREEYNAYKHGLRIIPASKSFMLADAETSEIKMKWDLSKSMSFYLKTRNPNELTVVTKLFDIERDYSMTSFCHNLIYHMVYYRQLAMTVVKDKGKKIPITLFGKEPIDKCRKTNVAIQDIEYTVKRENIK